MTDPCPCGSGAPYGSCCGPLLARERTAPTAETLMRSRYAAYARSDMDYLERTLLPRKRATFSAPDTLAWSADVAWTGLRVLRTERGGEEDETGVVEFVASFVKAGEAHELHEVSRFKKKGGHWCYIDGTPGGEAGERGGDAAAAPGLRVGRNDPCPCGSGKKFKKCCG